MAGARLKMEVDRGWSADGGRSRPQQLRPETDLGWRLIGVSR